MPPSEVQWQPALLVLVAGLALGAALVWWVRRRGAATATTVPAAPPLELRDLDGRVEVLLKQLRELDDTAAKRTPAQLARERYALELDAARALQERDALAPRVQPAAAAPAAKGGGAGRGFLWGVGTSAAIGLLLFLAWQAAERRPEGGSVTGSTPGRAQEGETTGGGDVPGPANDPQALELRARLERDPDNHELRLDLARHLLMQRDLMGVWNETQAVLEHDPDDPRALAYQSLVRLAMGQGELAVEMLKKAIATRPDLIEARQNLAFVYASLGRTKEAEAAVAEVARQSPEDGERLRQALAQMGAAGGAAEGEDPHRGIPPPSAMAPSEPGGAQAAAAAPAAAGGIAGVFGWIELDAGAAARVPAGTVLFLTVREAGVDSGPPTAVKRMVSGASFPLQFELGSEDSMMGQPLPAKMRIDVRADSDGDPMTRPASDPAGYADGVELGRTGVRITLR